jgi:hypothetical protein
MQHESLQIFADYFQFYVCDGGINPDAPTDWDNTDVERRLKVVSHMIVVCPVRNMMVPVEIQVHNAEPQYDANQWDHIVECSLALPTGNLQIQGCTSNSAECLRVSPGTYQVRVLYGALDTLRDNDLDGNDHYLVVLWPGVPTEIKVIKRYP